MQLFSHVDNTPRLKLEFTAHEFALINQLLEEVNPTLCELNLDFRAWYQQRPKPTEVQRWRTVCIKHPVQRELLNLLHKLEPPNSQLRASLHPFHMSCLYQLMTDKEFSHPDFQLCLFSPIVGSGQLWWNHFYHVLPTTLTLSKLKQEGVDLFSQEALLNRFRLK